ncbi:PrsW family intramembrane metalloprotease [Candidatus Peregrinibacteria bacterium]|jgi:protease PrsW|nr:PrsW family intramembrane metalloprotease [Candidatus Peregrinibacteria bacterium]MBT4148579.1 PrsW family intramembrane metalloprotease [Candidatus Peregrinibacteria bacterium]MBT4456356.1 PrsW family intramembrane metalloprotease [Candidatus Peregrinibacteria bacterium]
MQIAILATISVLPALFLLWFFEKQDHGEKEPIRLKNKVFFWGVFSTIIAGGIEINVDSWIPESFNFWVYIFIMSFITTALVEEGIKLWIVKKVAWPHKKFNEVMDGITYAVIAGLGFAMLENLLFVLSTNIEVGIARGLLAVPAHALFSGLLGYYIGEAKFQNTPWDARNKLWKGFLIAVFYHGLYDFLLFSQTSLWILILPLLVIMAFHLTHLISKARHLDKHHKKNPRLFRLHIGIRIIAATAMTAAGILSLSGTILAVYKEMPGYTYLEILFSAIFALIMLTVSYLLIRKGALRKKK